MAEKIQNITIITFINFTFLQSHGTLFTALLVGIIGFLWLMSSQKQTLDFL